MIKKITIGLGCLALYILLFFGIVGLVVFLVIVGQEVGPLAPHIYPMTEWNLLFLNFYETFEAFDRLHNI